MDRPRYKQVTIPKIESGKINEIVRDRMMLLKVYKHLNKMPMKKKRRKLSRLLSNWKEK